ncbi:MAG: sigma-70 family RNA polymerase sigma factor [Planctomycetota bacterium]
MTDPNPELTLYDISWLTALARTLTRDGALADDLVQQTWLVANKSEPPTGVSRPWLARVLRRLHLRSLRTESRRAVRERAASSDEALTGTAEFVERAELQRTLAECLLGLEEPYRTTLMHVAFEERTPRQIAASESVSVESVRRRLRKARELFRERLEREYDRDWKQWYAALLPYAELPLPGEVAAASAAKSSGLSTALITVGGLIMSNSLLVSIATVLVGSLAVSTVLWNREEAGPDVGRLQAPVASGADDDELVAARATQVASPERREVAIASQATAKATPAPAATPVLHALSGTLLMRDESDAEYPATSGEFSLWTSTGAVQVPVVNGAWQVDLAPDQRINFRVFHETELVLDDRVGLLTGGTEGFEEERTIAEDTRLALMGRWLRQHRFNVLDAETREHLSGVQIIERRFYVGSYFPHPGRIEQEEVVCQDAYSPVDIEPSSEHKDTYYVGCDWYAWTKVEVDHRKGGETDVLLEPGGNLRVRFAGAHQGPIEFAIHVEGSTGSQIQRDVNTEDEFVLRGLPLGRYVIAARAGMRAPEVRKEIEVLSGPNELVLEVPGYVEERAPVAGTLFLGQDAESTATELMFREAVQWSLRPEDQGGSVAKRIPLSSMERVDGGFRFDAGELFLGTYEVLLEGTPWSTALTLEAGGATNLRFEVESQGAVFVRLIEAGTSKVIGKSDQGVWHDPSFELNREVDAAFDEARQAWRVSGPAGRLDGRISFYYDYEGAEIALELQEEPVEIEVEIERPTTFSVEVYHREERVELSVAWIGQLGARPASTEESDSAGLRLLSGGWGLAVTEPGVHVISFGELEGYAPIPDRSVTLERGKHTELRVDLQRR